MKLYYAPQTRALRPRWLLEELGVPYEIIRLDMSKGEHKKPDYLAVHPHGAVPALVDGDTTLIESAAICAYLADKFPEKRLAPAPGTPARGLYYQWLFYAMATLEPAVLECFLQKDDSVKLAKAKQGFGEVAAVLEKTLAGRQFLLEEFSAADVVVGSMLLWSRMMGLLEGYPSLQAYAGRLTERPAFARARKD
jgi:glutathione S-transferase